MFRFRSDPLEDPVVKAWDAYVAGDPRASTRSSKQTFTVIGALDAAMADVEPDSDFLVSLERKLLGFNVQPTVAAVATPVRAVPRPVPPSKPPVHRRITAFGQPGHWAIAALLVLFLAGAAVLAWSKQDEPDSPQTIPAAVDSAANDSSGDVAGLSKASPQATPGVHETASSPIAAGDAPTYETLLDIQVNPKQLNATTPDLWDTMEFEMVSVKPGEGFSTDHPYFTCCAGINVFQILEGSASFIVESDADVYAAGEWSNPSRIPAGTLFTLGEGETVVHVMDQPVIVTNTGPEELVLLRGSGEQFLGPITSLTPDGYHGGGWATDGSMDPLPGEVVNVSFERIELDPGSLFHLETTAGERLVGFSPEADTRLRMLIGDFDAIPADNQGILLRSYVMDNFPPGPFTFHNAGDLPVTLYLMRIEEVAPVSPAASPVADEPGPASPVASPVVEAQPHETLLDIQVLPAELNANPLSNWDSMEFALVHVKAGESFSTDSPYFACCIGIAVFQVLEGSASFIAESDADVYAASEWSTPTRIPAGTLFSLSPEETAVFAMEVPAVVTNTGTGELVMLGAYSYYFKGPITTDAPDGYLDDPWVSSSPFDPLPGDRVQMQLERIALDPGELTHIETDPDDGLVGWYPETNAVVRMTKGAVTNPEDPFVGSHLRTIMMSNFPEESFTFFNDGENPATIYLFRISPVSSGSSAASPVADSPAPQPHENLLDIRVNPAEFGAAALSSWDQMEFALVSVNAGESFSTDHPFFSCCDGIATFQVREGSASFIIDGPAEIYSGAGDQPPVRVEAGTLFALNVGETAVFSMKQPAVVTNTGPDELTMLGGYAYFITSQGSILPPDGYQQPTYVLLTLMKQLTGDAVEFEIEQVSLAPGEYTHVEVLENERLVGWHPELNTTVRIAPGALDSLPDGLLDSTMIQSLAYSNLSPDTYTLFNTGKNPATLHFMRISGTAGSDGTPSGSPVAADSADLPLEVERDGWESVLNAVVQTSSLDFGAGPAWDSAYFTETSLAPSSGDVELGCCNGVHVLTVMEGEVSIELLPNVIQSFLREENSVDQDLSVLQPGESVIFGGTMTIANESGAGAKFLIGGVYPVDAPATEANSLMSVDIAQVTLLPGASAPLTVTENDILLLLADQEGGVVLTAESGYTYDLWSGLNESILEPGEYQMKNSTSELITVHTLRIGPDLAPPSS